MQKRRAVEGGRNLHALISEVHKYFVSDTSQIRAYHDVQILSTLSGLLFGSRNDVLNHIEGKQRFAALELQRPQHRRFDEVAADLGLSKSWASRLHAKAIGRLAKRLKATGIER